MKKLIISAMAAMALATLGGCGAMYPKPDEAALMRNPEEAKRLIGPPPDNFRKTVVEYMEATLKDPESAKYSYKTSPTPGWYSSVGMNAPLYGWGVCVTVNAKNSYGAYTGAYLHYFLINNDKVIYTAEASDKYGSADVDRTCNQR